MNSIRPELFPIPPMVAELPVDDRGYPVPWFVAWVDGRPEFRLSASSKIRAAMTEGRCWVCGQKRGLDMAFVIGPMCSVNRISAEPPSHLECALFAVRACPFLSKPHMRRRTEGMPEKSPNAPAPGVMIERNPGVAAVWETLTYSAYPDNGGWLFKVGTPRRVLWFAEGRPATRAEVLASIESGLPALRALAAGPRDLAELDRLTLAAHQYLPAEASA
ncbi:Uncharacterized protein OS=Burkholderia pseudomallei BPC006 GN=BPC006_II0514 PE=4 SV=1 [Gemmataceae bacterium]|nr:Uncharacterized protein OS=Burkholderia pseudomallei BPC006 GN=BPC006_II0514 PE=4 SV=1 [Gemmataceae bacterium]VTT96530.1 Uncharacterized protein OS=Burkholderia pseudomallei BPC006 GN=BPC006_II0514 PE=4 SV=1 [Gemmataceae bacterium]